MQIGAARVFSITHFDLHSWFVRTNHVCTSGQKGQNRLKYTGHAQYEICIMIHCVSHAAHSLQTQRNKGHNYNKYFSCAVIAQCYLFMHCGKVKNATHLFTSRLTKLCMSKQNLHQNTSLFLACWFVLTGEPRWTRRTWPQRLNGPPWHFTFWGEMLIILMILWPLRSPEDESWWLQRKRPS